MKGKVQHIYFIENCPGVPVYVLTDGTILLPFYSKKGQVFYYSEKQQLDAIKDDPKASMNARAIFKAAKDAIGFSTKVNLKDSNISVSTPQ